ncbi:Thioredoxin [uncultured Clostridium sp.]|uniref:thioredoxin n=1 Tax=uncultured Clostridium sp. TaxID=59620 RepID=UPI000821B455|nr:thioredoxin [uncultured Clostridium sp.]SCK02079.1 Thioredoxin [uncultured Clostridium sp.]
MIKVIDSNEFKNEIEKELVLVDFFAEWCGPCKMISPILEELQDELEGKINIIKVNVDNSMDITQQYNISNIPALVVLKKGEEVQRLIGFSPKQVIKENIEKYL